MVKYGLIALMLVVVAGCGQPPDDVIRFGLSQMPQRLDPRMATDAASSRVNRLLYESLTDYSNTLEVVPSLAHWVQTDALTYRFILNADRKHFSDGSALTAQDVVNTYTWVLNPNNGSAHRGTLKVIDSVQALDANTVEFKLSKPDPLFPGYLTIGIVKVSGDKLLGSGAFEIVSASGDSRLCLRRKHDGVNVCFELVSSPEVRVLKLIKGEIDILQNDLMPELERFLTTHKQINVTRRTGSNFAYLGFNLSDQTTGQRTIRKAIALAIDRDSIIKYVMGGDELKASALLPPHHWAGAAISPIPYDLEQAKSLLASLGYSKQNPLKIEYKTSSDPFRIRLASVIQAQLKQVFIDVSLKTYDWGTFFGDIKSGRFQMYSLVWVGIKNPDIFRYVFHSQSVPPEGANRGHYHNEQVDTWLDQAQVATDKRTQKDLYKKVQHQLLEDLPYVPLWYEDHFLATGKRISGYDLAIDGNYDGLKTVVKQ